MRLVILSDSERSGCTQTLRRSQAVVAVGVCHLILRVAQDDNSKQRRTKAGSMQLHALSICIFWQMRMQHFAFAVGEMGCAAIVTKFER
jgi:hypothetical protein